MLLYKPDNSQIIGLFSHLLKLQQRLELRTLGVWNVLGIYIITSNSPSANELRTLM